MDGTTTASRYGFARRVLGAATIVLGISGLVWGEFAMNWHPVQATMPHRTELAYVASAAFLIGGITIQWQRTARAALFELACLYLLGALLWMPRILGYPQLFGVWSGFAEEFSVVVAIIMYMAAADARGRRSAQVVHVSRIVFGLCILSFGIAHFTALEQTAGMVPAWVPPNQRFWAIATGAAMVLAGLSLMTGLLATQAAWCLTALLMSFGIFVWGPSLFSAPHRHNTWAGSAINLGITAAAWMVAEVLTARTRAHRPHTTEAA